MANKEDVNLDEMVAAARKGADKALAEALDDMFPAYFREFRAGAQRWAAENPGKSLDKYSYRLALMVKIQPAKGAGFEISAQSGFSVRHKSVLTSSLVQLELGLQSAKSEKAAA